MSKIDPGQPWICDRCGAIDATEEKPGTGPHWKQLVCACGRHIQWIGKPKKPTQAQLDYLHSLGVQPSDEWTRDEASHAIDQALKHRRAR